MTSTAFYCRLHTFILRLLIFILVIDVNGKEVGKFGCAMDGSDLNRLGPILMRLMTKPEKIETKMSFSHAGLSMHAEMKIDEQAVSRIVSEVKNAMPGPNLDQMDFQQLGGLIKFSELGFG